MDQPLHRRGHQLLASQYVGKAAIDNWKAGVAQTGELFGWFDAEVYAAVQLHAPMIRSMRADR